MYIFEWLFKYLENRPNVTPKNYDPSQVIENTQECEHFFMPIDSTGQMFACKYCGLVLPKNKIENKNIFKPD